MHPQPHTTARCRAQKFYFHRKILQEGETFSGLALGSRLMLERLSRAGDDARDDDDIDNAAGHWPSREGNSCLPEAGLRPWREADGAI